jgi:hypothetical protein
VNLISYPFIVLVSTQLSICTISEVIEDNVSQGNTVYIHGQKWILQIGIMIEKTLISNIMLFAYLFCLIAYDICQYTVNIM